LEFEVSTPEAILLYTTRARKRGAPSIQPPVEISSFVFDGDWGVPIDGL
jgi:hypothetical protein